LIFTRCFLNDMALAHPTPVAAACRCVSRAILFVERKFALLVAYSGSGDASFGAGQNFMVPSLFQRRNRSPLCGVPFVRVRE
jgi:hypothetical protein